MKKTFRELVEEVEQARRRFVAGCSGLSAARASYRPAPGSWSVADVAEHLYWAEVGGVNGIWKALEGLKAGKPVFTGPAVHHGLPIESIIQKTWKDKEDVPETARPRWGGALGFWLSALQSCSPMLEDLAGALEGIDPETVIYPHPISGPLNAAQRMEFLRYHMDRHLAQVEAIRNGAGFPPAGMA